MGMTEAQSDYAIALTIEPEIERAKVLNLTAAVREGGKRIDGLVRDVMRLRLEKLKRRRA